MFRNRFTPGCRCCGYISKSCQWCTDNYDGGIPESFQVDVPSEWKICQSDGILSGTDNCKEPICAANGAGYGPDPGPPFGSSCEGCSAYSGSFILDKVDELTDPAGGNSYYCGGQGWGGYSTNACFWESPLIEYCAYIGECGYNCAEEGYLWECSSTYEWLAFKWILVHDYADYHLGNTYHGVLWQLSLYVYTDPFAGPVVPGDGTTSYHFDFTEEDMETMVSTCGHVTDIELTCEGRCSEPGGGFTVCEWENESLGATSPPVLLTAL